MSKVSRYQTSIRNFIKNKSNLSPTLADSNYNTLLDELISNNDQYGSVLILSIMNINNKKRKPSIQGYNVAAGMEFLFMVLRIYRNYQYYENKLDKKLMMQLTLKLTTNWINSIKDNLERTKLHVKEKNVIGTIENKINEMLCEDLDIITKTDSSKLKYLNKNAYKRSDIPRLYFSKNKDMVKKFAKLKLLEENTMNEFMENTSGELGKIIAKLSWLLSAGEYKRLEEIEKIGYHFGLFYQLALDFENLKEDFGKIGDENMTFNYIINSGFQKAYEKYMKHKERFIYLSIQSGLNSSTVKELVEAIDNKTDDTIENSSPDLRSSYSTLASIN